MPILKLPITPRIVFWKVCQVSQQARRVTFTLAGNAFLNPRNGTPHPRENPSLRALELLHSSVHPSIPIKCNHGSTTAYGQATVLDIRPPCALKWIPGKWAMQLRHQCLLSGYSKRKFVSQLRASRHDSSGRSCWEQTASKGGKKLLFDQISRLRLTVHTPCLHGRCCMTRIILRWC